MESAGSANPRAAERLVLLALAAQCLGVAGWSLLDPVGVVDSLRSAGVPMGHRYMISEHSVVWRSLAIGNLVACGVACVAASLRASLWPAAATVSVALGSTAATLLAAVVTTARYAPLVAVAVWLGVWAGVAAWASWSARLRSVQA